MIISASYKTDIPAFYGEWFRNRLRAGFCRMVNPYNKNQHYRVSLKRQDVDGFVFWTKNLGPFFPILDEVHASGFPFIVQFTINGYPRELEARAPDADRSVEHALMAAKLFGPRTVIWRYDTIVFSSLTDADFHRRNFCGLASKMRGITDEVVVSFMQLYHKTKRNLVEAAARTGFEWEDPPAECKRALLRDLVGIAGEHRLRLTICTQPDLVIEGVGEARCVDANRLMDIAGKRFPASLKGMREGCGCFKLKDIGDYDTCPMGCIYCYAVRERDLALSRYRDHNPNGEYLFPTEPPPEKSERQLRLLPDE